MQATVMKEALKMSLDLYDLALDFHSITPERLDALEQLLELNHGEWPREINRRAMIDGKINASLKSYLQKYG